MDLLGAPAQYGLSIPGQYHQARFVSRGELKRYGMYIILKDNADFVFLMEYQLKCR